MTAVASGVTAALDESGPAGTATIDTGAIVKGDDPDVAGSGYISHAVSTGSLVTPTPVFGADGPAAAAATAYGLTVTSASSGLFVTDGSAINLQLVNGVVVGVVSGGAFNGEAAFAISINSSTGVVTVEQYLSLHQDSASNTPNDAVTLTAGSLGITVTVTDGDGDQASTPVDVSTKISFADDGPSVTAVASGVTAALDESGPAGTATIDTGAIVKGDDPDVAGSGYISHAVSTGSLVTPTPVFGADGPAAAAATAYGLTVTSASSGLFVTDGSAINLQLVNGVVVGVVSGGAFNGEAAFAISINSSTGVVTVEQYLSLHQDSASNTPNDAVTLTAGSLGITVTVTDGDGDQASTPVDVSTKISFADDGPSVTAVASGVTAALDESGPAGTATIDTGAIVKGDDPDVAGSGYISHAVSTGSLVTPTPVFGADGPAAAAATAYGLTVTSASSGLFVTDGSAINLQLVNGVVVGVVSGGAFNGEAAFAISINSSTGVVTVEQYLSLHQDSASNTPNDAVTLTAGSLGITVTVTDGDGDQASTPVDVSTKISFADDGPSVTAVASGVTAALDESGPAGTATIDTGAIVKGDDPDVAGSGYISHAVSTGSLVTPTPVFGADGPAAAAATAYGLTVTSASSGLFVTDGSAINLQLVNGVVVGVVSGGAFNGEAAFAISINSSTGVVTVEQYLSLHQDSASNTPNDAVTLTAGSLGITVTVTDGDGDQASTPVDVSTKISFADDGPSVTAVASGVTAALDESGPAGTATIDTGAIVKGDDPDVAGSGYISHAVSTGSLVTPTPVFGADGPAAAAATAYGLTVTSASSGLFVTDGSAINLQLVNGVVVGVVSGGAFNGEAAFAISINSSTGVVTVEQYLSLHQDSASNTPNDAVTLTAGSLGITVTVTDGDGDQASTPVDVSTKISFADDGPSVTAVASGVTAALDESGPAGTATIDTGAIVKGDDPDVAGSGYISHAVSTGSLVTPTPVFGADGPAAAAATAYGLTVTSASSGLFVTDGSAINLQLVNGVVVGVVSGGAFNGEAAFAISINSSTGVVTVEQYLSLHQDSASNTPNDAVTLTAGSLGITVTVTDGDGDQASTPVDVSTKISFADDGPSVTAVASGVTAALDESGPAGTATIDTGAIVKGDDPDVAGSGYISHAVSTGSLVTPTPVFGADGPAAAAATAYGLTVTSASSGLFVTDGSAINLQLVNGVVVGVVSGGAFNGEAAFAISINSSTGVVTVEQYLSLHQDSASNTPNDAVTLTAGSLGITVTVTDGDGDQASTPVDVSTKISFADDGPSVTAVASGVTAALDESGPAGTATIDTGAIVKGDDPDVAGSGYISHAVSTGSLVTPTPVFGADGPAAAAATAYGLTVTSASSGLFVTDGSAINLQLVNGVVVGVVSGGAFNGEAAFAISINSSTGVVTVEQYLSLHQDSASNTPNDAVTLTAGSLGITVTVTDGDGDQASTPVDVSTKISFADDGPSVTAVASGVTAALDESGPAGTATIDTGAIVKGDDPDVAGSGYISHAVSTGSLVTPTPVFGADGPAAAAATAYGLTVTSASSGLFVTDGSAINLQLVNGVVVGVVSGGAFNGEAAFAISINSSTGVVTVEQYLSLHQDSASNTPNDAVTLTAGSLGITVTVTDGDGDQASTPVDVSTKISFADDGPSVTAVQDAIMPNLSNTQVDGTWQPIFGADGPSLTSAIGVALSTGTINGITYTLTDAPDVGGHDLKQVVVNNGTSSYTFYEYTTYDPVSHSGEMFAFTDPSAATPFFELNVNVDGTYTFHLDTNTLQSTTSFNVLTQISNGPADYITINGTTVTYGNGNDPTSGFDVLIDGYSDTNTDPNANSGGDGNRISKDQNGMGLHNSNLETGETIFFEFGAQQSAFSLVVGKATTTSEHFLVTLYDQNHNFIASENVVLPDGSTLLVDAAHWGTGGTGTTSGAFGNFYEVDIKNVAAGGSEDSSIVITGFQFNEQVTVGNTALNFNLTTTDGDGDSFTSSDNLTVLLQGTHTGNGYQLTGANGAPEVLAASAGADTLIGGTGGGDTVDYSNTTGGVGVTIDLSAETDTVAATVGQAATGDVIKGVENIIGTQYADILTAAPGGSILIGGGGNDTLNGGVGNDTLIGGAGDDTLSGGGGNNIFVLQGSGGGHDSISGFSALADQIFVDVASQNLTIGTSTGITAGQFTSSAATGSDENALNAWNESASANKFFFNNASGELWYSANGTGADKVDLAHVSTGVPAAANIHTM
ncbi:Leu/Phe-tRNA-protein transferase [Bradyrhizobium sp. JR6.1]